MSLDILAHRANINGPDISLENSLAYCRQALEHGFGLEIDLRRDATGSFYISHDAASRTPENDFASYSLLFQQHAGQAIAVNVKELGYEADLLHLQQQGAFGSRDFYFDFELLEPSSPGQSQRKLAALPGGENARLASRLSDRGEPLAQCLSLPGQVVWADEFDSLWISETEIKALRKAGRRIYMISPELHGFSPAERLNRWAQFKDWDVDGLCTDYALEARSFFSS